MTEPIKFLYKKQSAMNTTCLCLFVLLSMLYVFFIRNPPQDREHMWLLFIPIAVFLLFVWAEPCMFAIVSVDREGCCAKTGSKVHWRFRWDQVQNVSCDSVNRTICFVISYEADGNQKKAFIEYSKAAKNALLCFCPNESYREFIRSTGFYGIKKNR